MDFWIDIDEINLDIVSLISTYNLINGFLSSKINLNELKEIKKSLVSSQSMYIIKASDLFTNTFDIVSATTQLYNNINSVFKKIGIYLDYRNKETLKQISALSSLRRTLNLRIIVNAPTNLFISTVISSYNIDYIKFDLKDENFLKTFFKIRNKNLFKTRIILDSNEYINQYLEFADGFLLTYKDFF